MKWYSSTREEWPKEGPASWRRMYPMQGTIEGTGDCRVEIDVRILMAKNVVGLRAGLIHLSEAQTMGECEELALEQHRDIAVMDDELEVIGVASLHRPDGARGV